MLKIKINILMPMIALILFNISSAMAVVEPDADIVNLKTSCMINGDEIDNCFTDWRSLNIWIRGTRKPNVTSPLKVSIGTGEFAPDYESGINHHRLMCNPSDGFTGYISYVGAGIEHTILSGAGSGNTSPLVVDSCTNISFSHLQISNPNLGINGYGAIEWKGGGKSHWNSVKVIGNGRAWYETNCGSTPGEHIWADSQIIGHVAFTVAVTYLATCDDSKFYASSISINIPNTYAGGIYEGGAVVAEDEGVIHVYGSNIVANIDTGESYSTNVAAASAHDGGKIHIHGTGIDVVSNYSQDVVALSARDGGMIHANSSAYFMRSSGTITRIKNNGGVIMAPYQWQSSPTPPSIVSVKGADQVVVTETSDGYPHQLIYDNSCVNNWYDTTVRDCY
ncbi:MAG TPA: hypothetical protein VIQ81_13620 [Gammaproteobacteria bacterium]